MVFVLALIILSIINNKKFPPKMIFLEIERQNAATGYTFS